MLCGLFSVLSAGFMLGMLFMDGVNGRIVLGDLVRVCAAVAIATFLSCDMIAVFCN